ncbi:MAG: DUF3592 domain-containing protein [Pseudomonadota bacterium]
MRHMVGRHGVTRIALTGPWALAVGMICVGIATYMFMTSSALLTNGIATEAEVVDVDTHYHSGKRTVALTLAYTDETGVTHRERTGYSTRHRWTRRGEQIEIRYNPRLPSEFAIDSWYGLWMMPVGFAVVGIAACIGFLVGPRGQGRASWSESNG